MKIALHYRTSTNEVYWTDEEGEVHYELVEIPAEFRIDSVDGTPRELQLAFGRMESPMEATTHLELTALNLVRWFEVMLAGFAARLKTAGYVTADV